MYVYAVLADAGVDTQQPSNDKLLQAVLGHASQTDAAVADDLPARAPRPLIGSNSNQSADPFVEPSVIVVVKPGAVEDDTHENLEVLTKT